MAEYLNHLLSGNGLLYISVHGSQGCLLGGKVFLAPPGHSSSRLHHNGNHHQGDKSQSQVGVHHEEQGADNA